MRSLFFFLFLLFVCGACQKADWAIRTAPCTLYEPTNATHPKGAELQQMLDKYTQKGIVGLSMAIYSPDGYWAGASGFAKIEDKTAMLPCHLQYSQSVAKTYMAVTILKLYEQGKINLDEKITQYLPTEVAGKITSADKITVRMLLNHTSGVPEYNATPAYVSYLLQHPLHTFTTMDYLNYIAGKPLDFEPSSKHSYRNTNYVLLALIADKLTGNHAQYIHEQIFQPLGLSNTFYRETPDYLNKETLVNTYWDRYGNGTIENCSEMQKVNVASLIGDDGIIAPPMEYVKFLKALFEGQLLQPATMNEMLTFVRNKPSDTFGFGLGIATNAYKTHIFYRHSGGGVGAGCYLVYLPAQKTFFFLGSNLGTILPTPLWENNATIEQDIFEILTK
jgi:D-alanyl-D-alanine carboxypeptidase